MEEKLKKNFILTKMNDVNVIGERMTALLRRFLMLLFEIALSFDCRFGSFLVILKDLILANL